VDRVHEIENLRRSLAMLPPGSPSGLSLEEGMAPYREVQVLELRLRRIKDGLEALLEETGKLGRSEHFESATRQARERLQLECPDRPLKDFHFPVGGRRFRPSLEDVIEFLVAERLASPRTGWESAVEEHRAKWEDRQLRAAVCRNPDVAIAQLREQGALKTDA
jgi:hypothetical protein